MPPATLSDMIADHEIHTIPPDETIRMACVALTQKGIGALPVVAADGSLLGILSERDVIRRSVILYKHPDKTPVSEIMTKDPVCLSPDAAPAKALAAMQRGGFRHVPVCDNGFLLGIISIRDFDIIPSQIDQPQKPDLRIA